MRQMLTDTLLAASVVALGILAGAIALWALGGAIADAVLARMGL